jgi:hypothetical protein
VINKFQHIYELKAEKIRRQLENMRILRVLIQYGKVLEQASRSESAILIFWDEGGLTMRRSDAARILQRLDPVRKGAGASFKIRIWASGIAGRCELTMRRGDEAQYDKLQDQNLCFWNGRVI